MKKIQQNYLFVWQIMKLTFYQLCLIAAFVNLSMALPLKGQEILHQPLSLKVANQSIKDVLHSIEKNTDVRFVYSSRVIDSERKVSLSLHNSTLGQVLNKLLLPLQIKYEIAGRQIVLDAAASTVEATPTTEEIVPLDINISGKVSDENGRALPGVNIIIKGTKTGTSSNSDGNYKIAVPNRNAVLVFSFVGYKTVEKPIGNQSIINVQLAVENNALDEVVVVGYGQVQKRDLTGSVVSIKEAQITSTPVTNVLETLQGKVAGMDLTRSSGESGAGLNFTIRGNRSLNASNQPLILVDGVQYGSYIDVNPNDVASVEVLKDASSTAIYGSRGANGVILITTKSGKAGKTRVEFNNYYGLNLLSDYQQVTNSQQFIAMQREAYRAAGQWSSVADDQKIFNVLYPNIQKGINTNWVNLMLHDGAVQNNHVALSGGNEKTKFRLSSEYFNEKGLLKYDELKRFVQHLNLDHQVADNLKLGIVLNFNSSTQQRRNTSFWNLIKNSPLGEPYEADGSIKTYPFPGSVTYNPLLDESPDNYNNETSSSRFFLLGYADWNIRKDLSLRSSFNIDLFSSQQGIFEGKNTTLAGVNSGYSRSALIDQRNRNWTWENVLNYNKTIKDHTLNTMIGTSMISYRTVNFSAEGKDQPFSSSLFYNLGTNTRDIITNSSLTESALASFFGRMNYKFKDRYFVTGSIRFDGSSVLAPGKKWAAFPSVALGWRPLSESFLANSSIQNSFSEFKLRASYGISGNSAISPYQTQGGLSRVAFSFDENPAFGYWPKLLSNKDLSWEKTETVNFGLDFGLFKNRITGTIDYYNTYTSDLLMDRILPSLTGYSTTVANVGKTKTRGIDIVISTHNIDTKKFSWSTDINFATFKEEIVALSSGGDDVAKAWFVGKPLRVFYDFEKIGIWQTAEKDQAAKYGKTPGEIKVKDQNNDGKISASDDRVVLGQATPKWSGGITNYFTYGNLSLSVLVYARIGQMIASDYMGYYYPGNTTAIVDYWTPENPTNAYPQPYLNRTEQYISTLRYADGSFWKIKDIRLSYNLPKSFLKKTPLSNVTIYSTAKNFFTFSHIPNYDPERGGSVDFPLTKQLVFGLNASF